jgi:Protein of unknown function (DUF2442)
MISLAPESSVAVDLQITVDSLSVELADGRQICVPLGWYPRLSHATPEECAEWQFVGGGSGIHWPALDEDVSIAGLIAGRSSAESQASLQRWLASRSVPA